MEPSKFIVYLASQAPQGTHAIIEAGSWEVTIPLGLLSFYDVEDNRIAAYAPGMWVSVSEYK